MWHFRPLHHLSYVSKYCPFFEFKSSSDCQTSGNDLCHKFKPELVCADTHTHTLHTTDYTHIHTHTLRKRDIQSLSEIYGKCKKLMRQ